MPSISVLFSHVGEDGRAVNAGAVGIKWAQKNIGWKAFVLLLIGKLHMDWYSHTDLLFMTKGSVLPLEL